MDKDNIDNIDKNDNKYNENKYNDNKQHLDIYKTNINHYSSNNIIQAESKTHRFLKRLLILSNVEESFVKIFGIDKLWIPLLLYLKKILLEKIPTLNKYFFQEKIASLTISYTHFTSTYYNQQNNSLDYTTYKSILCFVFDKNPLGCKFTYSNGGNLVFFDQFEEIQINDKIWLGSKNTTTNASCIYALEISSYTSDINTINKFIYHCVEKYKKQIQSESLVSSGLKYYKYLGMNNSNHQCMFDEFNFTQTKTFSNIFFKQKDELVHKIKYFTTNEKIYKLLGRPYSIGIMLHGKPGTGKTSCIKAMAALTQRNIVDISLKKIKTQKELSEIFYGGKINGVDMNMCKKLFVLEEFDCVIEKLKDRRFNFNDNKTNLIDNNDKNLENLSGHEKNTIGFNNQKLKNDDAEGITLDNLLELLDGVLELNSSMFVATTNYIDMIDRALIRPGRFDCSIEFDNADPDIIIQMINHFSVSNIKKLKKNKLCSKSSKSSKSSSTSEISSSSNYLTSTHIEEINKYSTYNGKFVWSPAKISQICLFNIDSPNYYDDVVNDLKKYYDVECKIL